MMKYLLPFLLVGAAWAEPALIMCHGKYALCAASPTTPTNQTTKARGTAL